MQNGGPYHRDTVAEIKERAKENANTVRGASATNLLKAARTQIQYAHVRENEGDLQSAFSSLTKAASLVQMLMDTAEFRADSGKKGALFKEFMDFQQTDGRDLFGKLKNVEAKLVELEKSVPPPTPSEEEPSSPIVKTGGGSIADRMRSLQSAGLSVATTKRISREIPIASPPMSPDSVRPNFLALQALSPPAFSPSSFQQSLGSPTMSTPPAPSAHALVPTSSLGPPSPSSSTSSSPRMSVLSLQDFAHTFPSIDEIEEMDVLKLRPDPTGTSSTGSRSSKPSLADLRANGAPPLIHPKPFPVLPMDMPRPSSTPIPPTMDTFQSRPSSPARVPLSPTVPRKPSNLALNSAVQRSPVIAPMTPTTEKAELPFKTLFPKTLHECKYNPNLKVLLLDVRTRENFEREHILGDAVVCIEPSILMRENVTAQSIEDALAVGPPHEAVLFKNRDKFDLVAMYDDASEAMGDTRSPTGVLFKAIYETAFRKILKNMPMLLVGGLQAWKREFGETELARAGSASPRRPSPLTGLVNGAGSSMANGFAAPHTPPVESKGLGLGHIRAPAESSVAAPVPSAPPLGDLASLTFGRQRSGTESSVDPNSHRPWIPQAGMRSPLEPASGSPRMSLDSAGALPSISDPSKRLQRKPAMSRSGSNSVSYPYNSVIPENMSVQHVSSSMVNGSSPSPIQYPQISRHISPQVSGSSFSSSPGTNGLVSLPPQASINPSPLARRRSDYIDQSQEAINGLTHRSPIDYPELSSQHVIRPPPAAASSTLDNRPRIMPSQPQVTHYALAQSGPRPPMIPSDYPVTYWPDLQIGTTGLKNLGNTCYMNSTIQCLSATVPFSRFFTDGRWKSAVNMMNPMGTKGNLANAFANILREMWQGEHGTLSPVPFRRSLCSHAPQFSGSEQHDSQEFLSFLLDGLHEDLNRILAKPQVVSTPEREAELERLPTQIASEQEWQIYRMRDDSLVVDFFQGQYRNRMECLTCHKTSTTYNTFMYLTLPVPPKSGNTKVPLQQCIDAFVKEEVMDKSDAWHCPHCKTLRKATKRLSLSRLPPVLLIHLKRFSAKGPFTDKIETTVEFPLKGLDLTNYMPPPLPPGVSGGSPVQPDDPRYQNPPYRYDLYGVTNHFGSLSTGHCGLSFGWMIPTSG
ncbi:Ubiquitin carboxyl-terminal hydrolase 8 [Trametes pubescens]|uniref:ubiquitinyl hydrolase 1 n=1 Tax=Trametes pubescens TaxID=154538 RepID=A0A1M2VQC7_TRAPU|nr:Ubiquitin carboxyl-terminal hydrolase 8 [Trametes pubescens]